MDFADLGLSPDTLKAVIDAGYLTPTPIQAQAIPVVLMGRDVLGVAQTGTGKTAAFTVPMIDILADGRSKARMPRSLIIAPTRELAAQISDNFIKYGKYHPLSMALLIGGESFTDQEKALDRGVDVLIATPGRLLDLYERGRILLNDVKIMVIDEADRMLDMGFIPDVERIVSLLPKIRQTLFFSATMDKEIRKLADKFLMNPKEISVTPAASAATTIEQGIVTVRTLDKREALRRILRAKNVHNAFIFCNRKKDVDILFKSLEKHGFSAVALHGDMPQSKRNDMLAKFKANEAELLVCSDVAARGLDISDVSHVINFDVPVNAEDYVHRIGRTGRAGKTGHAYTLATPSDGRLLGAVEQLLKGPIPPLDVPELAELAVGADAVDEGGNTRGRGRSRGDRSAPRGRGGERGRSEGGRGRGGRERPPREPRGESASIANEAPVQAPVYAAVEEIAPVALQEASPEQPPAQENQEIETQAADERPPRERKERGKRERGRPDRFSDARGAEDRARKTRRNPHGIAEMDIGDNVVAFGGFTPAFLLVDPYGGKGVPPETAVVEDEAEEPQDETPAERSDTQAQDGGAIEQAAATE
ncbi:MAG: DEAD/DEAH box helicase [Rhodospirillaceae bacterium]|nr:DEAD/DEAH box helicase [Rhodospirillaceae bacterium]